MRPAVSRFAALGIHAPCLRSLNLPMHLCTDRGPQHEQTSELSQTKAERRAFLRYSAIHRVNEKAQMSMNSQGEKMENEDHGGKQDQLEEHSLPGTNQAGKEPSSCEKNDQENRPGGEGAQHQDQLEEHSLPGTNQAGKA